MAEVVYHQLVHARPGGHRLNDSTPPAIPALPTPALLREALLWSQERVTATVSLHGNQYEVDAALVGRKVERVLDPFDLTRIEVRYQAWPVGDAHRW